VAVAQRVGGNLAGVEVIPIAVQPIFRASAFLDVPAIHAAALELSDGVERFFAEQGPRLDRVVDVAVAVVVHTVANF
jgi:hypothetical protein